MKDARIIKLFVHVFHERRLPVILRNGAECLKLVVDNSLAKEQEPYEMRVQKTFEAALLCCNALALMSSKVGRKTLNIIRNAASSKLVGMAVQLVQTARDELKKSCSSEPLLLVIQTDPWLNRAVIHFQV